MPTSRPTSRYLTRLAAWAALAWPATAAAIDPPEASGFVELRGGYTLGIAGTPWDVVIRARPTVELPLHDRVKVTATAEVYGTFGRTLPDTLTATLDEAIADNPDLAFLSGFAALVTPCFDPAGADQTWKAIGEHLALDRLFVDAYLPGVDLRFGRQALQWGSAFLINPTDPMPEVLFTEPWRPRRGVNALRATVPIGDLHQLQAVVSMDDRFRQVRAAARGTINVANTDISVVGAYRSDGRNGLVGLDIRGAYTVGFWFEGAMHLGRGGYGEGVYEELAVGVDYMAPVLERFVIAAQYYRNGSGGRGASNALTNAITEELEDCGSLASLTDDDAVPVETNPFAPVLSGRDYLLLSTSIGFVPELSLTLVALQNLGDGTGFFVPTLATQPTGWLTLSLTAQVPYRAWGDGGEFSPSSAQLYEALVASLSSQTTLDPTALSLDRVDLSRLVPEASLSLWARASF